MTKITMITNDDDEEVVWLFGWLDFMAYQPL